MSNFGQTLRGRNTLILIDGVSQNATRDNFRQLNSVAPESIERIEVISGASSVYGAGASGGIINIITKRNKGEDLAFSSKIGMTAGNNFSHKGFAYEAFQSATGRQGPVDWYLSANTVQRNDQFDGNGKRIPQDTSQGSNMDTQTYDLQGRFGWELDDDKKISLSLQDYKDEQDTRYTKNPRITDTAVAVKGLDLDDQPFTHNQAVNLNYADKDSTVRVCRLKATGGVPMRFSSRTSRAAAPVSLTTTACRMCTGFEPPSTRKCRTSARRPAIWSGGRIWPAVLRHR